MPDDASDRTRAAAEHAARSSYGKLLASLAARTRDVAGAEDALAEAFAAALVAWPLSGVPERPEAWLLTAARRRSIDEVRRRVTAERAEPHLALMGEEMEAATLGDLHDIPDERLRLMFACAHPDIERSVRAPLILQTVLGFDAATIASAFLVSPSTMAQRLVRAKARIREAGIPFAVPDSSELPDRLDAVLEAIYAAYAEGWIDPGGGDSRRRNLAGEALWLGRLIARLLPREPEALGLGALMLYAESRRSARRDATGAFVPLAQQDTALWNLGMIDEAEELLKRANQLPGTGRYQLEAAVQSAHAARRRTGETDWPAVAALYGALFSLGGSPVVAVNRAAALAECGDIEAAMAVLGEQAADRRLQDYQPYWAVRAALNERLGDVGEADEAYLRAIGLESDASVRAFLESRRAALASPRPN